MSVEVKHVKRLSDGVVIDVPAGHWSLTHSDYEEVKPKKPAAKRAKKSEPKE